MQWSLITIKKNPLILFLWKEWGSWGPSLPMWHRIVPWCLEVMSQVPSMKLCERTFRVRFCTVHIAGKAHSPFSTVTAFFCSACNGLGMGLQTELHPYTLLTAISQCLWIHFAAVFLRFNGFKASKIRSRYLKLEPSFYSLLAKNLVGKLDRCTSSA